MNSAEPQEAPRHITMPTVKGIFVRSHVDSLKRVKGAAGVKELERRFGKPIQYGNLEDVPVSDEIKILEIVVDILTNNTVPPDKRALEAGKLHFRDFATTPWGKMVFNIFSGNLKYQMLHTGTIAGQVFKGIGIRAEETGPYSISVYIANLADLNPNHFVGLFQEWVEHIGYAGNVTFKGTRDGEGRFDITWPKNPKKQLS